MEGSRGWGRKDLLGAHEAWGGAWWTLVWRGEFRVLSALEPLILCGMGRVPPVVLSGMWNGLELMRQIKRGFWRLH